MSKMSRARLTVRMDGELDEYLNRLVERGEYRNKSEAIRDAVRRLPFRPASLLSDGGEARSESNRDEE